MNTNVFIFKVGSIGDSLVALPAIKKIYDYYGRSLKFITNKPTEGVFPAWSVYKETKNFDDVFEFEFNFRSVIKLKQFVNSYKGKKILYYFADKSSFKRNFRNYLFFRLIGFDEVYGWKEAIGEYIERDNDGKLLEVEPEYIRLENIVDKYLKLGKSKNYEYDFFKYEQKFINECEQKFNYFLNEDFLVLGIGGKTKFQRWEIDNYIYILNKIKKNLKVVILGGNVESKEADIVKRSLNKETINLCGKTTILESSYILKNAVCYIGNDTGTAHLAGISGTKVFIVSSARNNINRWYPYGKDNIEFRNRVECEGCFLHTDTCKYDIKCLKEINKDDVLIKLKEFLND